MTLVRRRRIEGPDPALELADVKANLAVYHDDDDASLQRLIVAATAKVEKDCDRAFGAQTWEVIYDAFPTDDIELEWGPLVSVTSIKYRDADLVEQTLAADLYGFEEGHAHGIVHTLDTWPTAGTSRNAVVVRYVAGDGWPEEIMQAVHLLVGHWYRNREATGPSGDAAVVPLSYESCINGQRRMFA